LQLDLFGVPALRSREGPVGLSPSTTLVCAYLALAPREGRSRSLAAAQLFADCTEQAARRRLNTALWRLRTEVRSCTGVEIVADSSARTVALSETAEMTTDCARFHDLADPVLRGRPEDMTDGHAAQLEAAVVLHRGRLLEVCDDEWVLAERYRIENLYLTSLDYLLQYYGARGDVTNVTKYGELALDLEPLREDIHRHLIIAYGAAGRDDLVERQFERCRLQLLEQLGADPTDEVDVERVGQTPRGMAVDDDAVAEAVLQASPQPITESSELLGGRGQ